jgi:hypothetical protein
MSYFGIPVRNGLPIGLGSVAPLASSTSSPFSPASFFASGEQGWWFDPSNFATLFQDSAGTTPVTAVEQPVGLQLDLSQGLVLGPTLVTNGDFATDTWWTKGPACTISGGSANFAGSFGYVLYRNSVSGVAVGGLYEVTFTVTNYVSGSIRPYLGTTPTFGASVSANGTYTARFGPTAGAEIGFNSASAFTGSIDNVSIKAVTGNHRFQTTSANRPVVSARVNLLTKTEDFANAVWAVQGATKTTGVLAPDGTTTAVTIAITSNTGNNFVQLLAGLPSESRIATAMVKGTAGQQVFFAADDSTPQTLVTFTGDWQAVSNTQTASGNVYFVFEIFNRSGGAALPNVTFSVWHPDFRSSTQGVNLPAYQRVNTSTDYDSTGFPTYIKPNGSNQFMQTNSINFTATDKMTVWQGVRKLSDAARGMIIELSASLGANNGTFALDAATSGLAEYTMQSKGTLNTVANSLGFTAPITNVLTGIGDISGDVTTLRVNGIQVATNGADQGTGNYGNYPTYFYARGGTSLFFNGNDYGSIARGAASTAAQITAGETYINSLTKAFA